MNGGNEAGIRQIREGRALCKKQGATMPRVWVESLCCNNHKPCTGAYKVVRTTTSKGPPKGTRQVGTDRSLWTQLGSPCARKREIDRQRMRDKGREITGKEEFERKLESFEQLS